MLKSRHYNADPDVYEASAVLKEEKNIDLPSVSSEHALTLKISTSHPNPACLAAYSASLEDATSEWQADSNLAGLKPLDLFAGNLKEQAVQYLPQSLAKGAASLELARATKGSRLQRSRR